ncbi:MAG: NAD(P)/FAD-dependent oxidoreductase [Anaerovoracaceae bacterium]
MLPITKNQIYLNSVLDKVNASKNVAVIGGGFIGVEFAEQIRLLGKNVSLIELSDACLWQAFDKQYTDEIENLMKENGIRLYTNRKVTKINGDKKVESLTLDNGETLEADLVILALGVMPNSALAKEAGLELNAKGAIVVDQYTRTSVPNIFAVGDCAEKNAFSPEKMYPYY